MLFYNLVAVVAVLLVVYFTPTFFGIVDLNPGIATKGLPLVALLCVITGVLYGDVVSLLSLLPRKALRRRTIYSAVGVVVVVVAIKITTGYLDVHPPDTLTAAIRWETILIVAYSLFTVALCILVINLVGYLRHRNQTGLSAIVK